MRTNWSDSGTTSSLHVSEHLCVSFLPSRLSIFLCGSLSELIQETKHRAQIKQLKKDLKSREGENATSEFQPEEESLIVEPDVSYNEAKSHRLGIYNENSPRSKHREVSQAGARIYTTHSKTISPLTCSYFPKQVHTQTALTTAFPEMILPMIGHRNSPRPHPTPKSSCGNIRRICQTQTHRHRPSARNLAQTGTCNNDNNGRDGRWQGQTPRHSHFHWTPREDRGACSSTAREYA
jgi:hypothetical protein